MSFVMLIFNHVFARINADEPADELRHENKAVAFEIADEIADEPAAPTRAEIADEPAAPTRAEIADEPAAPTRAEIADEPAAVKRPAELLEIPAAKRAKIAAVQTVGSDEILEDQPKIRSFARPLPKTADQKLEARNKLYKKAADFLLRCRYKRPDDNASEIPLDFKEMEFTGPQSIMLYLKDSTMFNNHLANQSINACINQGFLIVAQYKADKKADKKCKKKDSYLRMANFLNLPGSEEANMRWFQRRQALAKISDVLDLIHFSYSCSATDLMHIAPQIFNANKLGYFDE